MPRQIPPLNALRAFEAVARHLSFTGAADELGVTQGAVSQQVKKLEAHLGLLMFRRVHQGLLLTDAGQTYLPVVRDAFDGLALGTRNMQSRERGGVLTVSVSAGFATKWLVPRSHRFYERHPEIDLRISTSQEHINFARGDVDLAVRHGDGIWPDLDAVCLMAENVFPVCSPALAEEPGGLRRQSIFATTSCCAAGGLITGPDGLRPPAPPVRWIPPVGRPSTITATPYKPRSTAKVLRSAGPRWLETICWLGAWSDPSSGSFPRISPIGSSVRRGLPDVRRSSPFAIGCWPKPKRCNGASWPARICDPAFTRRDGAEPRRSWA